MSTTGNQEAMQILFELEDGLSSKLPPEQEVKQRAARILKDTLRFGIMMPDVHVATVSLYAACREIGLPVTLADVGELCGGKEIADMVDQKRQIAKSYNKLLGSLNLNVFAIDATRYVRRVTANICTPQEVTGRAAGLIKESIRRVPGISAATRWWS
jgi:transcription initiation factor TFIIIB Brf1 subunit/transcription initiation factor TFIIB